MDKECIQLALVDDDVLMLRLLKEKIDANPEFNVMLTAHSGYEFLEALENIGDKPNLVLLDLRMKNGNGLDVIDVLTSNYSDMKIVVVSSHYTISFMGTMLEKGIHAFFSKELSHTELLKILKEVHEKGFYFTEEQVNHLRSQVSHKAPKLKLDSEDRLSSRELDVLNLICQQYTAKQIADKLFISSKTVEAHKSNLLLKTGVKNTSGLIIYAIQKKLIDPDQIPLIPS